jgi:hypothetical protein
MGTGEAVITAFEDAVNSAGCFLIPRPNIYSFSVQRVSLIAWWLYEVMGIYTQHSK